MHIKKAVFPVGGFGTRFLPITKSSPKELLPIIDKPLIQYAVEEAIEAGCTELVFITNNNKRSIEDYFDTNLVLEYYLQEKNETEKLKIVREILPQHVSCIYVRQSIALGLGDAIHKVKTIIGNEPFVVILADELMKKQDGKSCLQFMIERFNKVQSTIISVNKVDNNEVEHYGIINSRWENEIFNKIQSIIEKPKINEAPSAYAVSGRYIFTPNIFPCIEQLYTNSFSNKEIQISDAITILCKTDSVYALQYTGKKYDCGRKIDYIKAIVDFGLEHSIINEEFNKFIIELKLNHAKNEI